MNQADAIIRAEHAAHLLDDPLLTEAFDKIRSGFTERMINSKTSDIESIQDAHRMIRSIDYLRTYLRTVLNNGDMARQEMAEAAEEEERLAFLHGLNDTPPSKKEE